jgi:hypothetical protein
MVVVVVVVVAQTQTQAYQVKLLTRQHRRLPHHRGTHK